MIITDPETLRVLRQPIPNTEAADKLGVSEATIRRWRKQNNTKAESAPKILIWDIESSPILGYVWGMYEQNVIEIVQDWKLLTVSWSWYGSGEYHAKQLCDFKGYKKGSLNDAALTNFARNLLHEADYAVAHNGTAFDVKKINAKIVEHGLTPPAPYTDIDTLTVARRKLRMSSNKLDHLGATLGLGRKLKHSGFETWTGCMAGDKTAWEEMREYAKQDIILLESVFERLKPWIKGLNYNHFTVGFVCTNCGSGDLVEGGEFKTMTTKTKAWQCTECGTWSKPPKGFKKDADKGA